MNQLIGFWKSFFFIFLLGNILMGVFEIFTYVNIYPYIENSINLSSMEKRFLILFPFLKYFIVLSYAIYSFYLMYQYIDIILLHLFRFYFNICTILHTSILPNKLFLYRNKVWKICRYKNFYVEAL